MLEAARQFAIDAHATQRYGDKPYLYHLEAVVTILEPYGEEAQIIGYLHDVVEDTDITVQEIEIRFGTFVAECVTILSDEPGATRKERKTKTYRKMAEVSGKACLALLVKAADRLANLEACRHDGKHDLLQQYKNEHDDFYRAVYRPGLCEPIWSRIHSIFQ